ncbi:hypothetical protein [Sphingobium lactosutens]|uniref:Uncharacterized protein n=1 Tax=Sphingobium lactosutens DS20 TaxID=1331060 RepID=T0IUA7_9SPHN|nr:hypothetical protein [Sphingobium lactosutens]EQB13259.1 hypothetical protein RLDS_16105 [Sphingobium lactosutens DS20]
MVRAQALKLSWIAMLALAGCSDMTKERDDLRREVAELQNKVKLEQAKLDVLVEANRLRRQQIDEPIEAVEPSSTPPTKVRSVAMCYKDYCPCEGDQQGMDTVLCDQLEAGVDVDVRMMIAGRGNREVRRQLETGDY